MDAKQYLNKLVERHDLAADEAADLIDHIALGEFTQAQIGGILTALRMKGETVDEVAGLVKGMRRHMLKVNGGSDAIDVVGTGGDGIGTFNISTASALVVAGAEVKVAKHGNRAASSKCGSADVLEELGVNINLTSQTAQKVLKDVGMVFLFAPLFHPAMKLIAPVRKELGFRTVFNFLGPFLNPAGVKRMLMGLPNIEIAKKLSKVAGKLDYEYLLMIAGGDGVDEISLSGKTKGFEIRGNKIKPVVINPQELGFKNMGIGEVLGGDAKENAEIIEEILGDEDGAKKDTVVLNSAYALLVSGKAKDIREGIKLAKDSISSGKAKTALKQLIEESGKYA
ncbi:anthranilate phosphoribosyltransferase [Candidatus Daviesbacteria bacterium]|nr:anthranilate phosphoribosyltransferase [Candidatus Daviesbacteria bacterium]